MNQKRLAVLHTNTINSIVPGCNQVQATNVPPKDACQIWPGNAGRDGNGSTIDGTAKLHRCLGYVRGEVL